MSKDSTIAELQEQLKSVQTKLNNALSENNNLWESNKLYEERMNMRGKEIQAEIFVDTKYAVEDPLSILNSYKIASLGASFNTEYWIRCQRLATWWAMYLRAYVKLEDGSKAEVDFNGRVSSYDIKESNEKQDDNDNNNGERSNKETNKDKENENNKSGEFRREDNSDSGSGTGDTTESNTSTNESEEGLINGPDIDPVELNNAWFDAKRYAILFKRAALVKKDNHAYAASVINYNKLTGKVICQIFNYFDSLSFPEKDGATPKIDTEAEEYTVGVDAIYLDLSFLPFGDFVYCINKIGKEIYFERKHQKTMQVVDLLPFISATNQEQAKEIANAIISAERTYFNLNNNVEIENEQKKLVSKAAEFLDKIKWYSPKEGVKDVLDKQVENIHELKEMNCAEMGIPFGNAVDEQTLAADADAYKQYQSWIAMFRIERIAEASLDFDKVFPHKLEEVGEELEQKIMSEEEIGQKIEPQNQEAVKPKGAAATKDGDYKEEGGLNN